MPSQLVLRSLTPCSINSHPRAPVPSLPCRPTVASPLHERFIASNAWIGFLGFFWRDMAYRKVNGSPISRSRLEMEMDCFALRTSTSFLFKLSADATPSALSALAEVQGMAPSTSLSCSTRIFVSFFSTMVCHNAMWFCSNRRWMLLVCGWSLRSDVSVIQLQHFPGIRRRCRTLETWQRQILLGVIVCVIVEMHGVPGSCLSWLDLSKKASHFLSGVVCRQFWYIAVMIRILVCCGLPLQYEGRAFLHLHELVMGCSEQ